MTGSRDNRPVAVGGPRLKVEVTQHDIDWGTRSDSSRCMVAKAIAREVADAARIEVDTQTIRFTSQDKRFAYLTPLTVQRYVAAFDAGDSIEPFKFQLQGAIQLRRRAFTPEEKDANRLRYMTETPDRSTPRSESKSAHRTPRPQVGPDGQTSPPRVFKTHSRSYGHRLLRINQPMQATALDEPQP